MAGNQTNDSLSRRDFIKTVSLAGASMAVSTSAGGAMARSEKDAWIGNEHFRVSFDSNQGTSAIRRSDGTPLVTNATTAVNFGSGAYPLTTGDFEHSVQATSFSDQLGSGDKLT